MQFLPEWLKYLMFFTIGFYFGFIVHWLITAIKGTKSIKLEGMGMKNGKEW